jgi:hypothetical protein
MLEIQWRVSDDLQQADGHPHRTKRKMANYLVIAYRWGNTNDHWYMVYCGEDLSKAGALARDERDGRGGKYGVAVSEVTEGGEGLELLEYYPSQGEDEPSLNWRIEMIERLGHLMLDYKSGRVLVPDPDIGKLPRCMHYVDVPPPPPVVMERIQEIECQAKLMAEAHDKMREEARERRERIWCPLCDCAPVYVVEYSNTFWRVPRDESSGEMEVHGLEGNWCRTCEQLHLTAAQIRSNHARVQLARLKETK